MSLELQIQSLVYSLVYGMFITSIFNILYKYLFYSRLLYKICINFLFIVDSVILYFLFLKGINNGIFHSYFLIMVIVGGFISDHTMKKFRNKKNNT